MYYKMHMRYTLKTTYTSYNKLRRSFCNIMPHEKTMPLYKAV